MQRMLLEVALDEQGNPLLTTKGKKVLRTSYSVLQDDFFNYMKAAGYTDVERGERGSTEDVAETIDEE